MENAKERGKIWRVKGIWITKKRRRIADRGKLRRKKERKNQVTINMTKK